MPDWLLHLVDSPWVLAVLFACCVLDAVFPPVPSETLVLALGALAVSTPHGHGPHPVLVVAVAAAGAFVGDRTTYALGRRLPPGRLPLVPRHRAERLLAAARSQLERRGGAYVVTARYVPVGRVAVNVTAGMVGYPARRFTAYAAVASVTWATWTVVLGVLAGAALGQHPVLAVLGGVVGGLVVGLLLDLVLRTRERRSAAQPNRTMSWSRAPRKGPASSSGSSSKAAASSAASSAASRAGSRT